MPSQTPSIFRCSSSPMDAGLDLATGWGPTRRDLLAGVKLVPIVAKTTTSDAEAGAVISAKGRLPE